MSSCHTSLVAKVTDFGNSRFVDFQPGELARTLSRLPGTLAYMPPEALEASSRYGPSLDIFSFGHLALFVGLQVMTIFYLSLLYMSTHNYTTIVTFRYFLELFFSLTILILKIQINFLGRSEVERRGQYFEQLEDLLPGGIRQVLVQLIKNCLHNDPSRRPTAEQLVTSLEEMKGEVEGAYGELAIVDAVRQVMTVKALKANKGT